MESIIVLLLIIICLTTYFAPSFVIREYLKKCNEKTPNILILNLRIFHFLKQYRKNSKIKSGQTGPLYYLWFITTLASIMLLLLTILIGTMI
jgi:hypothetical protein